jgi:twinkle protein
MTAASGSPASTVIGFKPGFTTKGAIMLHAKLQLSIEHARWLEDARKIPCELASEKGVASSGENIGFQYRRNNVVLFTKVRKETPSPDGTSTKTFWIEPKGTALCLWNEDCLSEPSDDQLIITEGEIDALSFLTAGMAHVVSVPNGAPFDKPGVGDVEIAQDNAFRYLWDGNKLKTGLQRFRKIILATDDDQKGRVLRDELAVRLGRPRCWYLTYPRGCKDANSQRRSDFALKPPVSICCNAQVCRCSRPTC